MSITATYGGTTVTSQIPSITQVIPTPQGMYTDQIIKVLFGVQHDVESPPGGYAASLASGWLRSGEPHSITGIIDCVDTVQLLPFGQWTWGAGGKANPYSVQWEQAGYASFTEKMWLGTETVGTPYTKSDGSTGTWTDLNNQQMAAQFVRYATMVAETNKFYGWAAPRYGTQAELLDAINNGTEVGVWFSHNDITQWAGGTTHTDHHPNYPRAQHMALATQIYNGAPTPTPDPSGDWFDMATKQDLIDALKAVPQATTWAAFSPNGKGVGVAVVGSGTWSGMSPTSWAAFKAAHVAANTTYLNFGAVSSDDVKRLFGKQV